MFQIFVGVYTIFLIKIIPPVKNLRSINILLLRFFCLGFLFVLDFVLYVFGLFLSSSLHISLHTVYIYDIRLLVYIVKYFSGILGQRIILVTEINVDDFFGLKSVN